MAASEDFLSRLHDELAKSMLDRIKSGEATASDLNVVRQFLKDNGINCDGRKNPTVNSIIDELPEYPDEDGLQ